MKRSGPPAWICFPIARSKSSSWSARGLNSREIAERLKLGPTTVDSYRARIKEKLGIKNAAELYQRAAQWVESNP